MLHPDEIAALIREEIYRDVVSYRLAESVILNPTYHCSVFVKLRAGGRSLDRVWVNGRGGMATLLDALRLAQGLADAYEAPPDLLEINIAHSFQRLDPAAARRLPRHETGLKGLLLRRGDQAVGIGPTEMIAENRPLPNALDRLLERNRVAIAAVAAGKAELLLFDAFQLLVYLGPPLRAVTLYRGGQLVPPGAITRGEVERMAAAMAGWMHRQVSAAGRMVYKYWPSRGRESDADNSIRQWMATVCLNRIALRSRTAADRAIADRNLAHNLAKYFRDEGGLGVILEGEKVKLGAIALAALAIHEHPDAQRFGDAFAKLRAATEHLWQADGAFRTFLRPADRNDNQNFYPGEALLLWASILDVAPDQALQDRFLKSYAHYRRWFEVNPNPAFVPWHSQAYCRALRSLESSDMADFVLAMNDWLLPMQQWETAPHPDLKGRFYDPRHPEYGPPHASSTGVYLEGLIDAFALARRLGQPARAERYRAAILRGLRSLRQLQFRGDDDMFYIAKRERVFGGLRTETYDNTIRVDNVQHGLMAILKILETFQDEDFVPAAEASRAEPARPQPQSTIA